MGPMAHCLDCSRTSLGHKYVILCLICGVMSSVVGSVTTIIYALMRSTTSSHQYFETIPTYIPAILLIANGLVVMCLASSRARIVCLMKGIGGLYLVCALLSVVVTVTTAVLHLNRLQTYKECFHMNDDKTCTCMAPGDTGGNRFTLEGVPNCNVVHGLLFACLRGLFGLSVFAILISIFALMLIYQLLSHQKKKKYLQQLELRRRLHIQNRAFGSHVAHPSYVSPQVFAHNRNHSLRRSQFGNHFDDSAPNGWCLSPHSYDMPDSRSCNRNFEEEVQSNIGIVSNRSHSWTNWLNWAPNQLWDSSHAIPHETTNRRFFDFLRRNANNRENDMNANQNRWRSSTAHHFLPPHVFVPRVGSGGLSALPPHMTRYQDNHLRRNLLTTMSSAHRRTRSNDGIFQHLNFHNIPDSLSYNPCATTGSADMFAHWGPPPPYTCSQPQSLNRINTICNNMSNGSVGQHCRAPSAHSSDVSPASKMSTPLSVRRLHCNAFSSDGIRLQIEANDRHLTPTSKSCIVEIHVPYNEQSDAIEALDAFDELRASQKKSKLSFNTMPNVKRSEYLQSINPFKSLSNIPNTFPNYLNSTKKPNITDSELESNKSRLESIRNVFYSQTFGHKSSLSSSTPNSNSTSNTSSELTSDLLTSNNSEESLSATSFPFDPPTDYKSTLVIRTPNTQSSPITDQSSCVAERHVVNGGAPPVPLNSAQSMPNLSVIPVESSKSTSTRTQLNFWELHRIPSSGNTSTSQDLADFELEMDEESIRFATDLPNDTLKTKVTSDSLASKSEQSSSVTSSLTPELIKPPTPFSNQNYCDRSTSSTATLSITDPKPELIVNINGIQV